MRNLPEKQAGQALLIILLVMVVGLTVSLGLLFRTTTDIKLSREFEESSRAFSAAEAGVEESLRSALASGGGEIAAGVSFNFIANEATGGSKVFSLGKLEKENAGTVWLAEHGDLSPVYTASEITLCWKEANSDVPYMEAIVLYQDGSDYKVSRELYEPLLVPGTGDDCDDIGNLLYPYKTDITLPTLGTLLVLRLKPVGGDAFVAVDPPESVSGNSLSSQGREIISTGTAGDTVRKVRVVKSFPVWSEIFDYVLFSGGGLTE